MDTNSKAIKFSSNVPDSKLKKQMVHFILNDSQMSEKEEEQNKSKNKVFLMAESDKLNKHSSYFRDILGKF